MRAAAWLVALVFTIAMGGCGKSPVPFLFSDVGVAEWPEADDARGELIAEGYADPARPPDFTERWPMPGVAKLARAR